MRLWGPCRAARRVYFSSLAGTGGRVSLAQAPFALAPLVAVLPLPAAGRPSLSRSRCSRGSRSPLSLSRSLCSLLSPRSLSRCSEPLLLLLRWLRALPVLVLHSPLSPLAEAGLVAASLRLEAAATAEAEGLAGADPLLLLC